ncbi:MAG: hypothetical protein N2383_12580, partial [Caldilineales bacterium]|nr:hypothetical protein [Caldilineales bacterium]
TLDKPRVVAMATKGRRCSTDNPHYNPPFSFGYDLGHSLEANERKLNAEGQVGGFCFPVLILRPASSGKRAAQRAGQKRD